MKTIIKKAVEFVNLAEGVNIKTNSRKMEIVKLKMVYSRVLRNYQFSLREIAEGIGITHASVLNQLTKYDITAKGNKEMSILYEALTNFVKEEVEKSTDLDKQKVSIKIGKINFLSGQILLKNSEIAILKKELQQLKDLQKEYKNVCDYDVLNDLNELLLNSDEVTKEQIIVKLQSFYAINKKVKNYPIYN
jgi:hypothetical protein